MKYPAFMFYPRDWICSNSVRKMTGQQVKAYIYLLCASWLEDERATIPATDEDIAAMACVDLETWLKIKGPILEKFPVLESGRRGNERLLEESARAEERSKSGSKGGIKAQAKRVANHQANGEADTVANPQAPTEVKVKPSVSVSVSVSDSTSNAISEREGNGDKSPLDLVFEEWNNLPNLPKCRELSQKRRKALSLRLKEDFFAANWKDALNRLSCSKFAQGQNERGWMATFDWFISPDVCIKIMEGKYDNREGTQTRQPANPRNQNLNAKVLGQYANVGRITTPALPAKKEGPNEDLGLPNV